MEEKFFAHRVHLRQLLRQHPHWTHQQFAQATGCSIAWVKKWKKRLAGVPPDDEPVLHGLSRRPHKTPMPIDQQVVERILDIRDHPPQNLQRTPGPKAIIYYLSIDEALAGSGLHLPTSTSTLWRILDRHDRILRSPPRRHEPLERFEPMACWALDFKDVSSVPADPEGKQQHVVETLNVVDEGTSIVLDGVVRDDFNGETVIEAALSPLRQYGVPRSVRFDRDPRFVGSWSGRDFPSPFVRFWLCLGVQVNVCPPHQPQKNPFVERYNKSYDQECLQVYRPDTVATTQTVTAAFLPHYNEERPNQALSCGNLPPRMAFPDLPILPGLPARIDPDHWLHQIDGRCYVRRVNPNGSVQVAQQRYYIQQRLAGQHVTVQVDAQAGELVVAQHRQPIKRLAIKGLHHQEVDFASYIGLIQEEARQNWKRLVRQGKVATMSANRGW